MAPSVQAEAYLDLRLPGLTIFLLNYPLNQYLQDLLTRNMYFKLCRALMIWRF
jgi:hypothetical protein